MQKLATLKSCIYKNELMCTKRQVLEKGEEH